jgi:hypothetical protein
MRCPNLFFGTVVILSTMRRESVLRPLRVSELDQAALALHCSASARATSVRPVHLNELDWTCSRGPGGAIEQIGFVS